MADENYETPRDITPDGKNPEPPAEEISSAEQAPETDAAQGPFAEDEKALHFDPDKVDAVISERETEQKLARTVRDEDASEDRAPDIEKLPNILEALLFASGTEPLSVRKLAHILPGIDGKTVRKALENLAAKYGSERRGVQIEEVAGGFQLFTNIEFYPYLKKLKRAPRPIRLSSASMQVLALVAWKQPVIKADIDAIRGTDCGQILRNLIELELLEIAGRAEVIGRPYLYGTSTKFLDVFGLKSIEDLPKIEDLAVED
ncbi:MAG: SMC-Scp complex subunit ScpB [Planctomycetota bacterium]|jgi:segregation and condensation protein B